MGQNNVWSFSGADERDVVYIFFSFYSRDIVRHATRRASRLEPPASHTTPSIITHIIWEDVYQQEAFPFVPSSGISLPFADRNSAHHGADRGDPSNTHTHTRTPEPTHNHVEAEHKEAFFFFFSVYNTGRILVICSDSVSFASLITEISGGAATSPAKQTSTV